MWGWSFPSERAHCRDGAGAAHATSFPTTGDRPKAAEGTAIARGDDGGGSGRSSAHLGPRARTYHINTVSFIRSELEAAGWRPARPGQLADLAMWASQRGFGTAATGGASAKATAERRARRGRRELFPRAALDAIDDKALLAAMLRARGFGFGGGGGGDGVPETYLSVSELFDADRGGVGGGEGGGEDSGGESGGAGGLLFLKIAAVDAALGVWSCATAREVADAVAERGLAQGSYVVQREATTRPRLWQGRKCSVRAFVVAWGGELWMWREWLVKVHAAPYTGAAPDSKTAHVSCRGASRGVETMRGTSLASRAADLEAMRVRAGATLGPWAAETGEPSSSTGAGVAGDASDVGVEGQYAISGVDFLMDDAGVAHLIEVNCSPCLFDTATATNAVKRELAAAFCRAFVFPSAEGRPHEAARGGKFVRCF